jgi:hypothetical protein
MQLVERPVVSVWRASWQPLILSLGPGEVPRVAPLGVDGYALGFALVISIVTGVLFGVVPAWQASRPELQNTLKDNTRGATGDGQRHFARAGPSSPALALALSPRSPSRDCCRASSMASARRTRSRSSRSPSCLASWPFSRVSSRRCVPAESIHWKRCG